MTGRQKLRSKLKQSTILVSSRLVWQVTSSYCVDIARYAGSSGVFRKKRTVILESNIVMDFHRVEKGLALSTPRDWFGRETVERLLSNCVGYQELAQHDAHILAAAVGALEAYEAQFIFVESDWWPKNSILLRDLGKTIDRELAELGGTEQHRPIDIGAIDGGSFSNLARSRSSVRNFSDRLVSSEVIESAISVAQFTPSVCNRQASRVRIFGRGKSASEVLALQNGNRGFGEDASHVLLVTSDLSAFLSPGERNQAYIDGGMFAMSLVYALEDTGVNSCCLNWSTVRSQDQKLRKVIPLPNHEVVIMMIAIGYAKSNAVVTRSPRRTRSRVDLSSQDGE